MLKDSVAFVSSFVFLPGTLFTRDSTLDAMTNRKKAGRGVRKPSHSTRASAGSASGSRKFYAVRGGRGGFSGVLNSWDECALQTTGVRGSAFKKFGTYDEALAFAQNKALDAPFTKQKKTKYYAVRYNGFNEIFTSWEECSLYVKGVSNASYKSFRTLEEATEFAHAKDDSAGGQPVSEFENSGTIAGIAGAVVGGSESKPAPNEHLVVFTDGACTNNGKPNSRAGYGVFFGEGSPLNISKPLPGRATNQRAEMMAVLMAIRTVLDHDLVVQGGILEIRTDSMVSFPCPPFISLRGLPQALVSHPFGLLYLY